MKKTIQRLKARPIISAVIGLVLLIGIAAFAFRGGKSGPATTAIQRGNIRQIVSVTGNTKPTETVDLAFQEAGKIDSITIDVGAHVVQGQVLAALDASGLRAQLAEAQSQVLVQQAKLDALKRG